MKLLKRLLILLIVVLIVGEAYHMGMYDGRMGFFVWSARKNPANGTISFVHTGTLPPPPPMVEDAPPETQAATLADTPAAPEKAPEPPKDPNEFILFDGETLGKWKSTEFGGEGEVFVNEQKCLEFGFGAIMTGVNWTEEPPALSNYEISLDAMKLDGNDFFCALTFPVKESLATFVVGGWGGGVVGISSVDDLDASENETMNIEGFQNDVWYKIKVRVTDEKIEAWIDDRQMVDLEIGDKKISLRPGDIELSAPLGIASFMTRAQYRNLVLRKLPARAPEPAPAPAAGSNPEPGEIPVPDADSAPAKP
ncbi:MAG: DUF1080 domain-containing protein [Verrucomicrobiae bacterium]|nr:DUF1080 domain-containing protein [Verrucomicrobiae bacterium]